MKHFYWNFPAVGHDKGWDFIRKVKDLEEITFVLLPRTRAYRNSSKVLEFFEFGLEGAKAWEKREMEKWRLVTEIDVMKEKIRISG